MSTDNKPDPNFEAPIRLAFDQWKETDDYRNTRWCALHREEVDRALYNAYMAGALATGLIVSEPNKPVP